MNTSTTANGNNSNGGHSKEGNNNVDAPDAAFWEFDSYGPGGKLNKWIEKQLRVALKDVLQVPPTTASAATTTSKDGSNSSNNNTDIVFINGMVQVLHQNMINSLLSLKVVDAPADLVVSKGNDDDNDNDDDNNSEDDDDDDDYDRRARKKQRRRNDKHKESQLPKKHQKKYRLLQDPYRIWFQTNSTVDDDDDVDIAIGNGIIIWNEDQDDIPSTVGGKLAVLSIGGVLNALVAIPASTDPMDPTIQLKSPGMCQTTLPNAKALAKLVAANPYLTQAMISLNALAVTSGGTVTTPTTTSAITVQQLHAVSLIAHRAVADQVKLDILQTTPFRIQQMLASDLTQAEFVSVRKRVYDTVILGKGMGNAAADEDDMNEIPTASSAAQGIHDIEKFKKCNTCGNNDQSEFILDRKNGDVICSNCGTVVSESLMHEGSQFRKFEGEVDRNHHGDAANPLYSNSHNMSTSLSGVQPTTGAGIGGWGSGGGSGDGRMGGKRNLETILKNAHAYTELNVSQFGKNDRRTREGYKDRQKKDAFIQMTHTGDALNLHEAVVQRAKELFAGFRDDRELIQQFKGVLAACLCEAFEQLSAEGKNLLKQQSAQQDQQDQIARTASNNKKNNTNVAASDLDADINDDEVNTTKHGLSGRAARRNELHHANLAGKGGLSLNNTAEVVNGDNSGAKTGTASVSDTASSAALNDDDNTGGEKPAATWDLEDCRTWLLEASRRIAQTWAEERNKDSVSAKKYPTGPIEELEGQLVEHSITLCEHLESEWRSHSSKQGAPGTSLASLSSKKRVVTPRVSDMSKLGIKWQHAHERGSGGKGGVGNNGRLQTTATAGAGANAKTAGGQNTIRSGGDNGGRRTAGQILILKTSQKLGVILKDPFAGEAFHKELRSVIGRQEERKRKALRDEATRQRFHQMQRKPWLQARVQQQD